MSTSINERARRRHPSLHLATSLGLGLIVLLLVVNFFVTRWNIERQIENQGRVVRRQAFLNSLETVVAHVIEAETSERGYVITGDDEYLKLHSVAVDRANQTLVQLTAQAAEDARRQSQVDALKHRVNDRLAEVQEVIDAYQAGGVEAARETIMTNRGRELVKEMNRLVNEMQLEGEQRLALRIAESSRSAQVTKATNLAGSLMGIGLVALAFLLFRRELWHRQRASDALRRLAAIVESSDDAIVGTSMDGTIMSWNAGARRLYGYAADEVIGKPMSILCSPEKSHEAIANLENACRGGHIEHFETVRICKDGRRIDVSLSISPIRDDTGSVVGASSITRDITERKLLQREVLEIAAREQQRIGQDLHDGTGQELTGLAMLAERLTGELTAQDLRQADLAERIVEGLEQALHHVRALSKGLVPVELDAEGLMAALDGLAQRTSELHQVQCTFECEKPVRILDNQTSTHLYRLSQEAVTNALKHGQAHTIRIQLSDDGAFIRLCVSDDGLGIRSNHPESGGTGLRIMRYRSELIGAVLLIQSAQPRGTEVICTFPHQPDAQRGDHQDAELPVATT